MFNKNNSVKVKAEVEARRKEQEEALKESAESINAMPEDVEGSPVQASGVEVGVLNQYEGQVLNLLYRIHVELQEMNAAIKEDLKSEDKP